MSNIKPIWKKWHMCYHHPDEKRDWTTFVEKFSALLSFTLVIYEGGSILASSIYKTRAFDFVPLLESLLFH